VSISHDVTVVVGTRPELIKLAPVIRALERHGGDIRLVLTGQHREMVRALLAPLGLTPHADLGVMTPRQSLNDLSARLLSGMASELTEHPPLAVIVQGDTTTAMCAAVAAFHNQVPIAHVEAGLRSHNVDNPFPEEMNRQVVSRLTRWHFAPTVIAAANLVAEGVEDANVYVTGNTVIDNLAWVMQQGLGESAFDHALSGRTRVLVTLHRRENHGAIMHSSALAIAQLVRRHDLDVVFPIHRSPAVRDIVVPALSSVSNVRLVEPLEYFDFIATMAASDLIVTDSGGVQEEAPWLGKPVLVLRDTTERPEAIDAGVARLVGTDPAALEAAVSELCEDPAAYASMARRVSPYGDGFAAERIAERFYGGLGGCRRTWRSPSAAPR
jgi:UDP-N-acetylglucosamine 2-epimerase (non-hydrolysing)